MKLIKNTFNRWFLETLADEPLSLHKDFFGNYKGATIPLSPKLIKNSPTPLLEDLWAEINMELQERDRAEIEKMNP